MKKALIGYGGHASEVMAQMGETLPCFVSDEYMTSDTYSLSDFKPSEYKVMIAIADPEARSKIVFNLSPFTSFFTFIHPTALIMDDVEIGEGSFIGAYSVLTNNIKIGKHALLNRGNHIGHDCEIGDYFSAMPGSIVSGNVKIGNKVYLGTNASIREKLHICENVTIGMNTGITSNIYEPGVYYRSSFLSKK
jgi:sugar O-acyltransferase (sialic acid O-acetyltransferase NeuD family)